MFTRAGLLTGMHAIRFECAPSLGEQDKDRREEEMEGWWWGEVGLMGGAFQGLS